MRRIESQEWRQKMSLSKSSTAPSTFESARFQATAGTLSPCQCTYGLLSYPLHSHGRSDGTDERAPHSTHVEGWKNSCCHTASRGLSLTVLGHRKNLPFVSNQNHNQLYWPSLSCQTRDFTPVCLCTFLSELDFAELLK